MSHLSILHWLDSRVVGSTNDLFVKAVLRLASRGLQAERVPALLVGLGKELPGGPDLAVDGAFQDPVPRPWGRSALDEDVAHLEHLRKHSQSIGDTSVKTYSFQVQGHSDKVHFGPVE